MLLKDTSTVAAEILEGAWDEQLSNIEAAIKHRRKIKSMEKGLRPRMRVRFVNDPVVRDLVGKIAIVDKVNQKSVSVHLEDNEFASYRVHPDLLEAA